MQALPCACAGRMHANWRMGLLTRAASSGTAARAVPAAWEAVVRWRCQAHAMAQLLLLTCSCWAAVHTGTLHTARGPTCPSRASTNGTTRLPAGLVIVWTVAPPVRVLQPSPAVLRPPRRPLIVGASPCWLTLVAVPERQVVKQAKIYTVLVWIRAGL